MDNMGESNEQSKIKQVDSISFALGVALIMSVEYIVLVQPQFFIILFYCLMGFLIVYRQV